MTELPDTLLVNGHDLRTLTGISVLTMNLFAPGTRRGSDDVIPGRQGQVGAQLVLDVYAFSVEILVEGGNRADMLANLAAVGVAVGGGGGLVALTRRLSTTGGHVDHTASGRYVGTTAIELLNVQTARTELQFLNLDGAWSPDGRTSWLVP